MSPKDKREKKIFASLHCIYYAECLNESARYKKKMDCHKCEKIEIVFNNYRKEIPGNFISNNAEEYPLRIDHNKTKIR